MISIKRKSNVCVVYLTMAIVFGPGSTSVAHSPSSLASRQLANREPNQSFSVDEEAFIHTPTGFEVAGEPVTVDADSETSTLRVTVVDGSTGKPAACRVNVIGPDGNYFEPSMHPLAEWSCHKTAHDETHGPSRYYGFYFYSLGQFDITVPTGNIRIEAWKGYEYHPIHHEITAVAGKNHQVDLRIDRTAAMNEHGYYSGDTHIHLNRRRDHEEDDKHALGLMAAEDIEYGTILCMNDPPSYSGLMQRQVWPQDRELGRRSVRTAGRYGIASGQEYRCSTYGHICLLMHDRLVLEGLTVNADNWPTFDGVGRQTRQLGGFSFHAHGGYSREIYADYIDESTDGVELLQMAHYRGIGLSGWYRILNLGYQFPGLAGSDFPYGRCLGDCRNYIHADKRPDFHQWTRAAAEGRSFFTTGPLVLLEVNGHRPGDTISLPGGDKTELVANVRLRCEVTHVDHLELIVNGETVKSLSVPPQGASGQWIELQHRISGAEPCWIAARAYGLSETGRPDAEAHTNPVYVHVDGQKPFRADDRDWLLEKLGDQVQVTKERDFPEQQRVFDFLDRSRDQLLSLP